jgi:hypothetical protein
MDLLRAKVWLKHNPPRERIVDHKIVQSYCHEYPIIRDLISEVERLAAEKERLRSRLLLLSSQLPSQYQGDIADMLGEG